MNGLDNILRRIREETQAELDALQQETEDKILQLEAQTQARRDALAAAGAEQNKVLAENHLQRLTGSAKMEARQMQLQTKQALLDQVFALALQQVRELPDAEFVPLLASWVAQAAETGTEELIFSPLHRDTIGPQVAQQANALRPGSTFTVARETRDTDGVILRRGKVEFNGSPEARFRLMREQLAPAVAEILFS